MNLQSLPNLMPHQLEAFNGDTYIEKEFLKLKEKFELTHAVETGTCLGSTTLFLSRNFEKVLTIEINKEWSNIAVSRFNDAFRHNIQMLTGSSATLLATELANNSEYLFADDHAVIFFLDAHWDQNCPLQQELSAIARFGNNPVIAIHDFKVPGEDLLGYDSYNGQPFTFEWLKPQFDLIYGAGRYDYHYNTAKESTEIKRGIIYVYPNKTYPRRKL